MKTRWIVLIAGWFAISAMLVGCDGGGNDGPDMNYDGSWSGNTSGGGSVTFTVSGGQVHDLYLTHGAYYIKQYSDKPVDISGNSFSIQSTLLNNIDVNGSFGSATTCSGTYSSSGYVIRAGDVSYSGTFTANKR
jgi:hypothetical protein